ncbi:hypothetical protein BpHYR1_016399 [Brachionus plicatilis]|uniref:Uncharacterized protein n=1 Tax=Brachionus plicatilis TaxID=10195 RepID=A0A3M7SWR5_BRAPC|nr:hypothetical protein BpHYR1_016399 [Brachionus plicatilis]
MKATDFVVATINCSQKNLAKIILNPVKIKEVKAKAAVKFGEKIFANKKNILLSFNFFAPYFTVPLQNL